MQQYAEESVKLHMANLQEEFFKQNTPELNPTAPFLNLESEDSIQIFKRCHEKIRKVEKNERNRQDQRKKCLKLSKKRFLCLFSLGKAK